MSLSILIVTYNCEIKDSVTISSLLNSRLDFSGTTLCIWSNGPNKLLHDEKVHKSLEGMGFRLTLIQTLHNAPLSWIYNNFIKSFPSDSYAILDHDSRLSLEYLSAILKQQKNTVRLPIIMANGQPQSPCSNGVFCAGPYTKKNYVMAIGSGVIISKLIAENIKSAYGNVFDENFALYGVDTSFFVRIYKLGLTENLISIPGFEHSLSRLEMESRDVKLFRKIERSYDFGLSLRHYPSNKLAMSALKQILLWPIGRNRIILSKALKAFLVGRHERCSTNNTTALMETIYES